MTNGRQVSSGSAAAAERKVFIASGAWFWWLASALALAAGFVGAMGLFQWDWPYPIATAVGTLACYLLMAFSQNRAWKIEANYREQRGVEG